MVNKKIQIRRENGDKKTWNNVGEHRFGPVFCWFENLDIDEFKYVIVPWCNIKELRSNVKL